MDSKRFLSSMMIAGDLMLGFMLIRNYFTGPAAATTAPYKIYDGLPKQPAAYEGDAKPRTLLLGGAGKDDKSVLAVTVDTVTAGIDRVQLNVNQYASTYKREEPLTLFPDPTLNDPYAARPFATTGIHITIGNETQEVPIGTSHKYKADGTIDESAETISKVNETNLLALQYVWQVDDKKTTATDAVLFANFTRDNAPVARVTKRFHIDPTSYEITVTHTVENLTGRTRSECNFPEIPNVITVPSQPIHVRIDQLAMPSVPRDDPQTDDRYFRATALNTSNAAKLFVDGDHAYNMAWGNLRKAAEAAKVDKNGKPVDPGTEFVGGVDGQFSKFGNNPQLWVASSNRFFTIILRPLPETGNTDKTTLVTGKTIDQPQHVRLANIDLMSIAAKPADDVAIVRLTGDEIVVTPGKPIDEPLSVYMGPKKRAILQGDTAAGGKPEYAVYDYSSLVQFNTCYLYSFCVSGTVVNSILWVLDFLKGSVAFGNYGIAIMILVIVVRAILHPLTRASQVNMAKMGKQMRDVQPQLEAMKKKFADNKKKQSEEMMRIYRENKINPAGGIMGCLPMVIQMPIWAALYAGLRSDIDLRHAAFIPGWINDLASPDKLLPAGALILGHPVVSLPLIGDIYGFNLLPILLAGVFFFQMKVTTATQPKPADEQQAQMQKMSQYMIFLFPLMLYNAPSGLNLYIFASTMGGLLDTYFVRKTLRKQGILPTSAPLLPTHEDPKNESE